MSATNSADPLLDTEVALNFWLSLRNAGKAHRASIAQFARRFSSIVAFAPLPGCATAPSIPLFGAGFPAWLFCIAAGTAASVGVYLITGKLGLRSWLAPSAVSYPAIAALVAMVMWLILFAT
jgi:hypothetical protein